MKLISWNVNGIRAIVKKGFENFLKKENPNIICIQETKTNDEIKVESYKGYWNFASRKGYSGTATLTKDEPLAVAYGIGVVEHDKEGRAITLEFNKFFLVNVYTPNSGRGLPKLNYRIKWDRAFLDYLKRLESRKPVVFCGDLNVAHKEIDLANPKANYNKTAGYTQHEISGFENVLKSGFIDTFREFNKSPGQYTWWSYMFNARKKNIGWRIDYFCISKQLMPHLKSAFILNGIMGSDHCPVGIILNL